MTVEATERADTRPMTHPSAIMGTAPNRERELSPGPNPESTEPIGGL